MCCFLKVLVSSGPLYVLTQLGFCPWLLLLHTGVFPISSDGPPLQSEQVGAPSHEDPLLDSRPDAARQLQVAKTLGWFARPRGKRSGRSCWDSCNQSHHCAGRFEISGLALRRGSNLGETFLICLRGNTLWGSSQPHTVPPAQPGTKSQNHNLHFIKNKNNYLNAVRFLK